MDKPLSRPDAKSILRVKDEDLSSLTNGESFAWVNARWAPAAEVLPTLKLGSLEITETAAAWELYRPILPYLFPDEMPASGVIDSELIDINHPEIGGRRFLLKGDHALPIGASIKARGGVFEVLEHARGVAGTHGYTFDRDSLAGPLRRKFACRTIVVGSTGNLAYSVARVARALGFQAEVHISSDATPYKKDRLASLGAVVVEHRGDYSFAVEGARNSAANLSLSYLVDDERSERLFLGYSHGAALLARQLEDRGINVGCDSPIVVYLPCGVGGAPGGLTLGLKLAFGDAVACVFVEPTQSPCFMVQLMAGKEHPVSVYDIGLTNKTVADGLAVPSASLLAANLVEKLVDGCVTVSERAMLESTAWLQMRNFPIEPSAASALSAVPLFLATCLATSSSRLRSFAAASATHIVWSTGRSTPDTDTLLAKTFKDWITHRGLERIR